MKLKEPPFIFYILPEVIIWFITFIVLIFTATIVLASQEIRLSPQECIEYSRVQKELAEYRDQGRSPDKFTFPKDKQGSLYEKFHKFMIWITYIFAPMTAPEELANSFKDYCFSDPIGIINLPNEI